MGRSKKAVFSVFMAFGLAALVLASSLLLAYQVENSRLYRQSTVVQMVVTREPVGIRELVSSKKNLDLLLNFAGAVASAYLNFELIPVHEASTFTAVFESLNDGISVEHFSYQRKNLVIEGVSESLADYNRFAQALRNRNYFDSVSGDYYITTENSLQFQFICVAASHPAGLGFMNG